MTIIIDTSVLISAFLTPSGVCSQALKKILSDPSFTPVISDYIIDELLRKVNEKFPHKILELQAFLFQFLSGVIIINTPNDEVIAESRMRDPKDRPIIRAAVSNKIDFLLTGDKDFLNSTITEPQIISVSEFLAGF